ncbi:MAG: hypothetical protein Q7N95_11030 [Alphaproteobacteria bacterium]|nr:hypothetical protein [Alphaproteobacteria bacterium]
MSVYEYEYGSVASGLQFTIVYDDVAKTFTIKVLTGAMNVNALYWSDGDATGGEGTMSGFDAKKDASLNMNGANTVWNEDGTTSSTKETWDGGVKISSAGLGSTPPVSYITAGSDHDSFVIPSGDFDVSMFSTLGVRATSTTTAEGSIKWVDDAPDKDPVPPPPVEVSYDGLSQGYWSNHTTSWDGHAPGDSFEALFGLDSNGTGSEITWNPPGPDGPFTNPTLLEAIDFGGGDQFSLAREAVAAVLNADSTGDLSHPYRFTAAEIEQAVQLVYGIGNANPDNVYNATMGAQLQDVLEFWNHAQHDEATLDLNATADDVKTLILAGELPNLNTDADILPGLTGSDTMYTASLLGVLEELYGSAWA